MVSSYSVVDPQGLREKPLTKKNIKNKKINITYLLVTLLFLQ